MELHPLLLRASAKTTNVAVTVNGAAVSLSEAEGRAERLKELVRRAGRARDVLQTSMRLEAKVEAGKFFFRVP